MGQRYWLVLSPTPLKNCQLGWLFPMYGKRHMYTNMFQITNQYITNNANLNINNRNWTNTISQCGFLVHLSEDVGKLACTSPNWVSDGFICSHGKTKEDHERNETKLTQLAPKEPYPLVISCNFTVCYWKWPPSYPWGLVDMVDAGLADLSTLDFMRVWVKRSSWTQNVDDSILKQSKITPFL